MKSCESPVENQLSYSLLTPIGKTTKAMFTKIMDEIAVHETLILL